MKKLTLLSRRPAIEALEDRRLMAGDVFARIINGNLRIRGDEAANTIEISAGANPGQVLVVGLDDANGVPTGVNGIPYAVASFLGFTGRIEIEMRGGEDNVSLDGLASTATSINLGRGNDTLVVTNHLVNGAMTINGVDGDDDADVTSLTVTGLLTVDLSDGDNNFHMQGSGLRDVRYLAGRGDDEFSYFGSTIQGKLIANLGNGQNLFTSAGNGNAGGAEYKGGSGDDVVHFEGGDPMRSVTVDMGGGKNQLNFFTIVVNKDARVVSSDGEDYARIDDVIIHGNFNLNFGNGRNTVLATYTGVDGNVELRGGSHSDDFTYSNVADNASTKSLLVALGDGTNKLDLNNVEIAGKTEIKGGKNDDDIYLSLAAFDSVFADLGNGFNRLEALSNKAGRVIYKGGNGIDESRMVDTDISGKLVASLGNGSNVFQITSADLAGDVEYKGGSGPDSVIISNVNFSKSLLLDVGGGTNEIGFGDNTVAGRADFKGGDGFDEFRLLASTFAKLNVALGKSNDRVIVSNISTTGLATLDGNDGRDSYLDEEGSTSTFAERVRKNFEIIGTTPPLS